MRQIKITIVIMALASGVTWGQQDPQISLYLRNPTQINAAHVGGAGGLRVTALTRMQWVGWEDAPRTQCFSVHSTAFNRGLALGLSVVNDASGARSHQDVMGQVAYHLPTVEGGLNLSGGLNFGLQMDGFDFGDMYAANMQDDWIAAPWQQSSFNMGFGFLANVEGAFLGVSVPHVLQYELGNAAPIGRYLRHRYWTFGYTHRLNSILEARLCGLVKSTKDAPSSVDVNAEVWFKESISVGLMARFREGMGVQTSYRFKDGWRVHYGVDFPLNGIMSRTFGSHEIGLAWDFGLRPVAYTNPRYF